MEKIWKPTANFVKLAEDLYEIRVSLILSSFEKALEMKKCIEIFLRSGETTEEERELGLRFIYFQQWYVLCGETTEEREKVRELLLQLKESKSRREKRYGTECSKSTFY